MNTIPQFTTIAQALLPAGRAVMFDVGAHMGFMSFAHAKALRAGTLETHLFEANPQCVQMLTLTAALYPREAVRVNWCCVSDKDGASKLTYESGE